MLRRRRRNGTSDQQGQAIVFFCLGLVAVCAVGALLIDGGLAWAVRRQAQAAADTGALAAAQALDEGRNAATDANAIASANGFEATTTDCAGNPIRGVIVNNPPATGAFRGDIGYVEVVAQRAVRTSLSGVVGQPCWMVSARAVAVIDGSAVSPCSFCSLNNTSENHTLVLKNSATLRVDGEIHVNSTNGGTTPGVCETKKWFVCGDGFDIFGAGGYISAKSISVVGGWETHDGNIATADALALKDGAPCPEHPNPPSQAQTSNVCIHMPVLPDPFFDPARPRSQFRAPVPGDRPVAGVNGCPSHAMSGTGTYARPATLSLAGNSSATLCPGTYYGGIRLSGNARATLMPGVYLIVGGGFQVIGNASMDGSAGVMIYNGSAAGLAQNTNPGVDHVPAPVATKVNVRRADLRSSNNSADPNETVTFRLTVERASTSQPIPTGYVDFYDGDSVICYAVPLAATGDGKTAAANCNQSYPVWGNHSISAVYLGNATYNASGDTVNQTVAAPGGASAGPVTIQTGGAVQLHAMESGRFSGVTIFQERQSNVTVTLNPGNTPTNSPVPACGNGFMTTALDPVGGPSWMQGCGQIGGLRGTVYAGHPDALVYMSAGGLAYIQVMAGKIQIDSGADARFAYRASYFANGSIHLVE
jgi:hypothetical protein